MKVRYDLKAAMKALGMGGGPDYPPNDPSVSWKSTPQVTPVPTRQDIIAERDYGTPGPKEGDEARRISVPALLRGAQSLADTVRNAAGVTPERDPDKRLTTTEADYLYGAKMLASRSPTAALGYDERNITMTTSGGGYELNYGGAHLASVDHIWTDTAVGISTPVHESIHRGIAKLKRAGSKEANELSRYDNEMVTRAIMLRHFGDLEEHSGSDPEQIKEAAKMLKNPKFVGLINSIDKQAAHLRAKELMETHPLPVINFNDAVKAARGER